MGVVSLIVVAGRKAPAVRTIPFKMMGVADAILPVDQGMIAVLLPVIGVPILQSVGAQAKKGIMREKKGAAIFEAQGEPDPIIFAVVLKMVAFRPAAVIDLGADRVAG